MTEQEYNRQLMETIDRMFDSIVGSKNSETSQPEPEPVAWRYKIIPSGWTYSEDEPDKNFAGSAWERWQVQPLYTAPPQREWQGLTNEEYEAMAEQYVTNCYFDTLKYARAIEAKLKEKNT